MKRKIYYAFGITTLFLTIQSSIGYAQELQVAYFGHVGYTAKFNNQANSPTQSAFNSGGLDVLLSSQISDKLTGICELFRAIVETEPIR